MSDVATMAGHLADPVRAALVMALMDGRAWTAGELAASAGASPQLASHHLARLVEGGVVSVRPLGRRRYHRIAGPEIARAVEALAAAGAALPEVKPRRARAPEALLFARTCYDHLAGRLGVAVADRIHALALIDARGAPTEAGRGLLAELGREAGRAPCRACLDWTERREHLAGGLANSLLAGLLDRGLIVRGPVSRAVTVTPKGALWLRERLGLDIGALAREAPAQGTEARLAT